MTAHLELEQQPDAESIDAAASQFEGAAPEQVLTWAAHRWPGRVVLATGFGAEGSVLVDIVGRLRLPIRIFTLETGYLFGETHEHWRRLEQRYAISIEAVVPPPAAALADELAGEPLHRSDPDRCCFLRKVEPLGRYLEGQAAWATAIRRDQSPDRARARVVERDLRFGLVKLNPLAAWTHDEVWEHLRRFDVPTHPLHARGYVSIGCAPCTTPVGEGEDARAGRWRGQEKTECGLHSAVAPLSNPGDLS